MRKILVSLITLLFTVYSFADVQPRSCLGFQEPPEWNNFLLPDGPVWEGLEPATCADISSAAFASRSPGEVWASGSGNMRCGFGLVSMYGNPMIAQPTQGIRGTLSREHFEQVLAQCLRTHDDGGCTYRSVIGGVSIDEGASCPVENFTSLPVDQPEPVRPTDPPSGTASVEVTAPMPTF